MQYWRHAIDFFVPVLAGTSICTLDVPFWGAVVFHHLTFGARRTRSATWSIFCAGKWNSRLTGYTCDHGIKRHQFRTPTLCWKALSWWARPTIYTMGRTIFIFNPVLSYTARIPCRLENRQEHTLSSTNDTTLSGHDPFLTDCRKWTEKQGGKQKHFQFFYPTITESCQMCLSGQCKMWLRTV